MPQGYLPIFPSGVSHINSTLAFKAEDGIVTYFNFSMPIFRHREDDVRAFRMITSQFCSSGHVSQAEIVRAFGVSKTSMKRAVKLYEAKGVSGFYEPRKVRGRAILTESVLFDIQSMLDEGRSVVDIASVKDIKRNTIEKAIRAGRLHCNKKKFRKHQ